MTRKCTVCGHAKPPAAFPARGPNQDRCHRCIKSERGRRHWQRVRTARIAAGLCTTCGDETPMPGRETGKRCRALRRIKRGKGTTCCSVCGERGHNRRSCADRGQA